MNKQICIPTDDEIECIPDNDSEKCWRQTYNGDSRKWLIRDASHKMRQDPLCSTMKDSYRYVKNQEKIGEIIGRHKELLLKQFEQEAINEVIEECHKPPTIEEYCTEYDRTFKIDGFQPDDELFKKNKELYKKYPLYSSIPTSYYSYKLLHEPSKEYVHGFTKITDNINPFKRSAEFSKPLNEMLDDANR